MGAGPETRLTNKIKKHLLRLYPGSFIFKVHGGGFQQAGLPDLMGSVHGRCLAIEVKRPGEPHPLTPLQKHTLDLLDAADAIVGVAHSPEEAEMIVALGLDNLWDWRKQGYHDDPEEG